MEDTAHALLQTWCHLMRNIHVVQYLLEKQSMFRKMAKITTYGNIFGKEMRVEEPEFL